MLNRINRIPTRNQTPRESVVVVGAGEIKPTAPPPESVMQEQSGPLTKTTILLIGLDGAGKSTIANHYVDNPFDEVTPTNGFERATTTHAGSNVTIFGLGGNAQIRDYWPSYFDEVHGVVFVVDASDSERLFEACELVRKCAEHKQAYGKPILIYLNKQDLEPLSATELLLDTDELNGPTNVVVCKARVENEMSPRSPAIMGGLAWLIGEVDANRAALEERVECDVKERKAKEKVEREERRRRREEQRARAAAVK